MPAQGQRHPRRPSLPPVKPLSFPRLAWCLIPRWPLCSLAVAGSALAAQVPAAPAPVPTDAATPNTAPPSAPTAAGPAASAAPAAATEPRFDIWEYEIEGNSVLPVPAIEAAVSPHLGPDRDMKAVEAARSALEAAYQKAGFLTVLVDVPEQRVDGGVVRLQVLEGQVGALYVTGSRFHDQGFIRRAVPALVAGAVPDFNQVQAQLDSVNRAEARRVQPVLKPGRRPGTVDVELQVNDSTPLSGSLELNNQHGRDTDPLRLMATLRHANVLQRDHALALTVQTAPTEPSQTQLLVANYTVPADEGSAWTGSLTVSNSDVETLGGTQVLGRGTTWGLRHSQGVGRAGSLSWGADLKLLRELTVFGEGSISTPLRYMPFQLNYSDVLEGVWGGRLQWSAGGVVAFKALLAREVECPLADGSLGMADQFACKRQGADGSFVALRFDARWSRPLPWGSATWRLAGQGASGPLVSAEQFSLGGADSIRGYLEGESSGDHGLLASVEWRSPSMASLLGEPWRELNALAFVEAGRTHTAQPAAGQAARVPLAGAGLGLRFGLGLPGTLGAEGGLDFAWPLKATTSTERLLPRLHARLAARF